MNNHFESVHKQKLETFKNMENRINAKNYELDNDCLSFTRYFLFIVSISLFMIVYLHTEVTLNDTCVLVNEPKYTINLYGKYNLNLVLQDKYSNNHTVQYTVEKINQQLKPGTEISCKLINHNLYIKEHTWFPYDYIMYFIVICMVTSLINLIFYKTKECELKELETMKIQYLDKIKDVC